jgi:hypothetical protein
MKMFGLRKRVKECEIELEVLGQSIREAECEKDGGHRWQFSRPWEYCGQTVYKFRCYRCEDAKSFWETRLPPYQRRELEYLGILSPEKKAVKKPKKKGGKK